LLNQKELIIRIEDHDYYGWVDVSVTRALDQASSSFQFSVATPDKDWVKDFRCPPSTLLQILYGEDLLITGRLDSIQVSGDASDHTVTYSGRSITKDIIDCSAINTSQIVGKNALQIAQILCEDYGTKVVLRNVEEASLPKIPTFQVNADGETVFEAIQRVAEMSELVISDTPEGYLSLGRIGETKSKNTIVNTWEKNTAVKSVSGQFGEHITFSEVIVKGQSKGDTKETRGKTITQILGSAVDKEMRRTRVKIIRADVHMTQEEADKKAMFELKGTAGKGTEITYELQDWTGNKDALWREGEQVTITDSLLYIDSGTFIIARVDYKLSGDSGTTCTLVLNDPESFEKDPADPAKQRIKEDRAAGLYKKPKKGKKKKDKGNVSYWQESDGV
jgi:prophage tail gpP-like protein